MKRNINLQELSKDHHQGLLLCWKIRQGIKRTIETDRIAAYCRYFFDNHLLSHFKEEEEHVFACMPDTNPLKRQVLSEHQELRQAFKALSAKQSVENLLSLANLLEAHIRFEERTLFPHMEQALTDEQLNSIGVKLRTIHQPFTDTHADEFWQAGN